MRKVENAPSLAYTSDSASDNPAEQCIGCKFEGTAKVMQELLRSKRMIVGGGSSMVELASV